LSTPALLETQVRFLGPFLLTAAMRFSGIPHKPKPPTILPREMRWRKGEGNIRMVKRGGREEEVQGRSIGNVLDGIIGTVKDLLVRIATTAM